MGAGAGHKSVCVTGGFGSGVAVGAGVAVGTCVGSGIAVGVGVAVGTSVGSGIAVGVGVAVGTFVGVGVTITTGLVGVGGTLPGFTGAFSSKSSISVSASATPVIFFSS